MKCRSCPGRRQLMRQTCLSGLKILHCIRNVRERSGLFIPTIGGEATVAGYWQMVGGSIGPGIQPGQPNYVLIVVSGDAVAAVIHAAERQNGEMVQENRKSIERLASERSVFAEVIKEFVVPIIPLLMRIPGGPALFKGPTNPLLMLQMIRSFNPHDSEHIGNSVRNFYEAEGYFNTSYQGIMMAYEFMESTRIQWEHLIALSLKLVKYSRRQ